MPEILPRRYRASLSISLVAALAACGSANLLNSERIEQRFGSFGIEVLPTADELRHSSLYSEQAGARTTRTYAVVQLPARPDPAYAGIHERILGGASIGATFKASGWSVRKETLYVDRFEVTAADHPVLQLMRLDAPARIAVHVYRLDVGRNGRRLPYASIAELHHPEYLDVATLQALYPLSKVAPDARDSAADYARRALASAAR